MSKQPPHVNLTALSPIEYRPNDPEGRVEQIKEFLAEEGHKHPRDQIFNACPTVHMCRIQVLDDIIPAMGMQPADSLKTQYLLLVAELSGSTDDFLDSLYNGPRQPFCWRRWDEIGKRHSDFVKNIWGRCIGYPDRTGAVFFRQYIARCRIKVTLPFAAYDYTVQEVLEFKRRQESFTQFVIASRDDDADTKWERWKRFLDDDASHGGGS